VESEIKVKERNSIYEGKKTPKQLTIFKLQDGYSSGWSGSRKQDSIK